MPLKDTFRAFCHRNYFIFWCGLKPPPKAGFFQLTNSPFYLGLEGPCLGLPRIIFSPWGRAIVDRTDRKTLIRRHPDSLSLDGVVLGVMDYLGMIRVWHVLTVSG